MPLGISLLSDFAKIVFEEGLPTDFYKNLIGQGKDLVKQNFPSHFNSPTSFLGYEPYIFAENEKRNLTGLLSHVKVPGSQGDAHGLDIDHNFYLKLSRQNSFINYIPHNIDNWNQASTLLHLWLKWLISVNSELKNKHGNLIERLTSQQNPVSFGLKRRIQD